jgi:hypothetical protein
MPNLVASIGIGNRGDNFRPAGRLTAFLPFFGSRLPQSVGFSAILTDR